LVLEKCIQERKQKVWDGKGREGKGREAKPVTGVDPAVHVGLIQQFLTIDLWRFSRR
jgi:hypothetical protein